MFQIVLMLSNTAVTSVSSSHDTTTRVVALGGGGVLVISIYTQKTVFSVLCDSATTTTYHKVPTNTEVRELMCSLYSLHSERII